MFRMLRRLGYGWIALQGLFAAALPKQVLGLSTKLSLWGFQNPEDLEAKPWYLTAVRATGVGLIAAGLTGLVLENPDDEAEEPSVAIDAPEPDEDA